MYSLLHKKQNAHEDSIWTCAWGRLTLQSKDDELNGDGDADSRDSAPAPKETMDYIVTGSVDDAVKVWEFKDNALELKHKLNGHSLGVVSVAVSSDSSMIASSSLDSSLRLWNAETGEKMGIMETGPTDVWSVAFSPDNKYIISGNHTGKINMYNVETQKQERSLDTRGQFTLSIAYSPDGKYIASGAIDGIINIFDVAPGKLVRKLDGHAMPIRSLCFSPDSQLLLTASDDGSMKIYDVQHFNLAATLSGNSSWVLNVAFAPDKKHFVSGSSDHSVRVWELASHSMVKTFNEHTDQRFRGDHHFISIVFGKSDEVVITTKLLTKTKKKAVNKVWGVEFNKDSNKIVSVSEDRSINIYQCPY